jgi:hypothetical protein
MSKFPNRDLEQALRQEDLTVQVMWQEKGPPNTEVAWMECLLVDGRLVIVQTYKDGNGWQAFKGVHGTLDQIVNAIIDD